MAKPRVYEIAKDLGLDSKTVLEKLKDMGEFVKSASSTVEPPVERKLKAALAPKGDGAAKGKGKEQPKAAAPKATPKPIAKPGPAKPGPAKPGAAKHSAVPGPKPHRNNNPQQRGDRPAAQHAQQSKPGARPAKPGPKPAPAQHAAQGGSSAQRPHTPGPRPGNNPFSRKQGMHTPTPGDIPRPHPMARPTVNNG